MRRSVCIEARNPLLLHKNLYSMDATILGPFARVINADFLHWDVASNSKSNARNGLVKVNRFSVVSLCFVVGESTNEKIIPKLLKSITNTRKGVFADTNFLKCNNISVKR